MEFSSMKLIYSTHMDIPSTVVGWKSTSRHTVQISGVKKTKLTKCGQKLLINHLKLCLCMPT